jgi:hypothetical protein
VFVLTAVSGAEARRVEIAPGEEEMEMPVGDLPPGFYVWSLESGGRVFARGKVVMVR